MEKGSVESDEKIGLLIGLACHSVKGSHAIG